MFRRGAVYWIQDNATGKQETLGNKDRREAKRLSDSRNEAHRQPLINLQIARAYLSVGELQSVGVALLAHHWQDRRWRVYVSGKNA